MMTLQEYFDQLPVERKQPMTRLRTTLLENLPKGFTEVINYGMPSYVVPHSLYPAGYHCDPELPLGFISLASQQNYIALYHMGVYSCNDMLNWFTSEYPKHSSTKLDMGKSCIRFKKPEDIPYSLIAELAQRMTPDDWIEVYERVVKR
ncbi:DUF1801 domain-containing protein [Mucilaginibacter sp. KACC 22063]|uniref:DUF1801 domain-containing protein n=1 Tax=Mucilaginibacter sp. KACC 22063 TaxID=3025666 RepID=UPI002366B380|nr:DUF1801 domain-containing protein [Mucilaginibacter sp. KACC 22063]WDF55161.1 DUF1801 domain-containing protein [Mucilaginibacter sp. KACC 22063]